MKSKKGGPDGHPSVGAAVDNNASKSESAKQPKSEKRSKKDKHHGDHNRDAHHHSKKSKPKSSSTMDRSHPAPAEPPGGADRHPPAPNDARGGGAVVAPPGAGSRRPRKQRHATLHLSRLLRPPPSLDPLLLSRGMSSRYLSPKVSGRLAPLSKEGTERDLRHMEAYRNACNGYNQQLFVYENQELVRSGYFGTFAPLSGRGEGGDGTDGARSAGAAPPSVASGVVPFGSPPPSKFSMPIRIDPEEEKRLSLLRKRIHQSEFEREKLETEYLSLRAHYVHEIKLVRKTRSYELGRWQLLREAMRRRARMLAWTRVRAAAGRDVEALLRHRGRLAERARGRDAVMPGAAGVQGGGPGGAGKSPEKDVVRAWNDINTQLREAEAACAEIETPSALSQMVGGGGDPTAADGDKGKGGKEASSGADNNDSGNSNGKKGKGPIPEGLEPHVIPWDCVMEPQTPFQVPLLLSCLSSATDKTVGFVTDKLDPAAVTWLASTLPVSVSAYDAAAEDLAKLREEVRVLEEELGRESDANTQLQEQIVASRSRSDEMVAMMQLLRSETEAVLERHNIIMETPEARAKSAELHKKLLEEEKLKNPPAEGDEEEEEEGEVDEMNEDLSSGEDEIQDDDEEEDRSDDDSVGIKEITVDKDSSNAHVGEETDASEEDEDDASEEEGEIAEGEEEGDEHDDEGGLEEEEPRRSKRRPSLAADDEESSSLTPPNNNSSSYRKRRRY